MPCVCRRRRLLHAAAAAAAMTAAAATASASPPEHILFLLIDDYGFADASYKNNMYSGAAAPPTPTIDSLAMSGVRLESYYVNSLCSPTRTALLSGRYAYTIGMENTVIVDGQNCDLPLNLLTMADYFQQGHWNTSAFGKWDAGMTVWGSTPTCRGFDHYSGFYSAASDYFTHMVGPGYDYHRDQCRGDKGSDASVQGVYTTEAVTNAVQDWITGQLTARPHAKTFAYVAHEAVHGPLEVPPRYINDECRNVVGDTHPTRLIYCGMVRSVDQSVKNITQMYEQLGILQKTLIVLSADNVSPPNIQPFFFS
jgi:arylsulfatase B